MIQVLDPQEWNIQIESAGYKNGKVFSICSDLGEILKFVVSVLTTNEKSLYYAKKESFLFNPYALVELKFQ